MSQEPLTVVPALETDAVESIGPIQRVVAWLDERLPVILKQHIPYGRRSAELQLSERECAPLVAWQESGIPEDFLGEFLELLAQEFDWPQSCFFPNDPLRLVLLPRFEEDLAIPRFQIGLERNFAIDLTIDDVTAALRDDSYTLGNFVRVIYERSLDTPRK